MIVQAYSDGSARIFIGNKMLCEFNCQPIKKEVDKHLKLLRMERREKWRNYRESSMSEAKVRFISPKGVRRGK